MYRSNLRRKLRRQDLPIKNETGGLSPPRALLGGHQRPHWDLTPGFLSFGKQGFADDGPFGHTSLQLSWKLYNPRELSSVRREAVKQAVPADPLQVRRSAARRFM